MTTVVITQPMLFPWPGFFEQLMLADVYIYLEDVQFSKGSFTNRVQIYRGEEKKWMTIPLEGKGAFQRICDLKAVSSDWRERHLEFLAASFAHAPHAEMALDLCRNTYLTTDLNDLLIASTEASARVIGVGQQREVHRSREMGVSGRSWRRVLDLVLAAGGTRYVTGYGAAAYMDHEAFESEGIAIEYMDYSLTTWPRKDGGETPYQSILDLVAWTGPEAQQFLRPATMPWRTFMARRAEQSAMAEL